LPTMLIVVAVPAEKVPDASVMAPFKARVVVLPPTLKVFPDLLTVTLLKVCVKAVPLIAWAVPLLNVTVLVPGLNVPPLFVQFPEMSMVVAVPAEKIPAVNVKLEFSTSVVVLPPTLSVCPVLFTVRLLNVCDVALPLIDCAAVVLLNVTVPVPGVNVPPLFVQSPPMLMFVPAVNVPAVNVSVPVMFKVAGGVKFPCVIVRLLTLTVVVPPAVFNNVATALLTTTSLNVFVARVPVMDWAPEPLNVTVPVPAVNVDAVAADQFPPTLMSAPAVNVPAVNVTAPETVSVGGAVKLPAVNVNPPFTVNVVVLPPTLSVCPVLFTVRLLNVCDVALPLIDCAAVVLLNVTVPVPGVNVPPLFVQSPPMLMFVPAVSVPAVKVSVPVMFKVAGGVKFPCVIVRLFTLTVVVPPAVFNNVATALLTTTSLNVFVTNVPRICCAPLPLNVTVPVPAVNVDAVAADQFPPTLILAPAVNVPAVNVTTPETVSVGGAVKLPAVNVNPPFTVSVVVLPPTLSTCPVLFTVMLLNVCVTAVPLIDCPAVVLLNVTVPAPGVNVPPLFVQSPPMLMFVPAVNVSAVKVSVPVMFKIAGGVKFPCVIVRLFTVTVAPPAVFKSVPTPLLITTSLNVFVANVPSICCAPLPLNVTTPALAVNTDPVAADQFPARSIGKLLALTSSVLLTPMVRLPLIVKAPSNVFVTAAVATSVRFPYVGTLEIVCVRFEL